MWDGSSIGFDSCPLSSQKVSSQYLMQVGALHPFIFIHSLRECNQSVEKIESQNLEVAIRDDILPPKNVFFQAIERASESGFSNDNASPYNGKLEMGTSRQELNCWSKNQVTDT